MKVFGVIIVSLMFSLVMVAQNAGIALPNEFTTDDGLTVRYPDNYDVELSDTSESVILTPDDLSGSYFIYWNSNPSRTTVTLREVVSIYTTVVGQFGVDFEQEKIIPMIVNDREAAYVDFTYDGNNGAIMVADFNTVRVSIVGLPIWSAFEYEPEYFKWLIENMSFNGEDGVALGSAGSSVNAASSTQTFTNEFITDKNLIIRSPNDYTVEPSEETDIVSISPRDGDGFYFVTVHDDFYFTPLEFDDVVRIETSIIDSLSATVDADDIQRYTINGEDALYTPFNHLLGDGAIFVFQLDGIFIGISAFPFAMDFDPNEAFVVALAENMSFVGESTTLATPTSTPVTTTNSSIPALTNTAISSKGGFVVRYPDNYVYQEGADGSLLFGNDADGIAIAVFAGSSQQVLRDPNVPFNMNTFVQLQAFLERTIFDFEGYTPSSAQKEDMIQYYSPGRTTSGNDAALIMSGEDGAINYSFLISNAPMVEPRIEDTFGVLLKMVESIELLETVRSEKGEFTLQIPMSATSLENADGSMDFTFKQSNLDLTLYAGNIPNYYNEAGNTDDTEIIFDTMQLRGFTDYGHDYILQRYVEINGLPLFYDTAPLTDGTYYTIVHGGEVGAYYTMFGTSDELPDKDDIALIVLIATTLNQSSGDTVEATAQPTLVPSATATVDGSGIPTFLPLSFPSPQPATPTFTPTSISLPRQFTITIPATQRRAVLAFAPPLVYVASQFATSLELRDDPNSARVTVKVRSISSASTDAISILQQVEDTNFLPFDAATVVRYEDDELSYVKLSGYTTGDSPYAYATIYVISENNQPVLQLIAYDNATAIAQFKLDSIETTVRNIVFEG